ncbi:MAG: hypothetical protein EOT04_01475 [Candidatus Chaera renei]|uniref:Uncharacterized protein n=1 Tax=Candidatus Chaera renei TaxID=2506947 RepID=A0A4Q0AJ83_9BACT|nr:MAG: hypothetical protein EOT04_01475 [Candidatus Chaera renei]
MERLDDEERLPPLGVLESRLRIGLDTIGQLAGFSFEPPRRGCRVARITCEMPLQDKSGVTRRYESAKIGLKVSCRGDIERSLLVAASGIDGSYLGWYVAESQGLWRGIGPVSDKAPADERRLEPLSGFLGQRAMLLVLDRLEAIQGAPQRDRSGSSWTEGSLRIYGQVFRRPF